MGELDDDQPRRPPERKGSSQTVGSSQPEFGDEQADDHPAQTHRDSQQHSALMTIHALLRISIPRPASEPRHTIT
ncbi:hypothetical protein PGT21_036585 [Puccinia graminis f. sp. tritici]|uniref:Uncharacterized protein n=1 Tax=Puccinia graminis f. sp. tritici TaxID=56615 RepID=A0A5B0Q070_PUCGR|nr:hypothetical protein PGT21_036585 [Puccinia graminis f. sp. tritici]KAA1126193.1 hypothetical protein PGTUg99_010218 [Puccinia graminis f. sp. tritici]